jgi:L-threonate 2-dehydrogenase
LSLETVGVIGLGIMGSAISENLLKAGFKVVGFDILPARRGDLTKMGGVAAANAADVTRRSDVLVTSLPSVHALADTAEKLSKSARRHQIIIETSTLPIPDKEHARKLLATRGVVLLDCPLSGTGAQARKKDLIVYASGDVKACKRVAPVFEGFSRAHYYIGSFGAGSRTKFIANLLVAIHNVAAAEAMVLGMKAGLDPATLLKVICDGAGNSRILELRGPMMVKGDYSQPTMKLEVWQKDMTVIGDFARNVDCPTPLFSASVPFYNAAMAMGLGEVDTASVCEVLERMANYPRRSSQKNGRPPRRRATGRLG